MAAGIRIKFLSDVADFLRGTKDVDKALEDVGDSLDQVARDGDAAADKLEKSFKNVGRDLGTNVKKGAKDADEGLRDLKNNTAQNLKETTASIHSAEDAIGGVQGLLAESLEGFGPAGVIAGSALAAGLGLAVSAWQKQSEKIKQLSHDLTDALISDNGRLSEDSIVSRIKDLATDGSITKLADQARKARVDVATFIRAVAGDPTAIVNARRQLEAYVTSVDKAADGTNNFKDQGAIDAIDDALRDQEKAAGLAQDALSAYSTATTKAGTASANAAEQFATTGAAVTDAATETATGVAALDTATASYVASLTALADPVSEFNTLLADETDKGPVTIEQMIEDMAKKARQSRNFETNLRNLAKKGVDDGLIEELRAQGPAAAGATASLLAHATPAQLRAYMAERMKVIGKAGGDAVGEGVKAAKPKVVRDTTETARAAHRAAQAALTERPIEIPVKVKLDPASVQGVQNKLKAMAARLGLENI